MDKKPRVLMVNYEFPPIGGGGGTTTRFIAKYMSKLNVDVSVITSKSGDEDSYEHPDGFKIYYVGPKKNKISTTHIPELARFVLTTTFYAKKIIETTKPDLIHCYFTLPSGCFGLYCNKLFKIPFIVSALGADVPGFNIADWRLDTYHKLTRPISKSIWKNASSIVANGSKLKELCEDFDKNKKIDLITNGVDQNLFYPAQNSGFRIQNSETIQLLFVSRLMPQKGIETLIDACGILKEKGITNFKLSVVGDGHLKSKMFSLIDKYSLENNVDHLGWKSLEELPDIYRNSDLFILPSSMEGMPSVVLQAMSCGLPIVATNVDGFKEVVEDNVNGFLVEYKNAEKLSEAIEQLIKSKNLRDKMSKESIEKSKRFSWESIAKKYLELYIDAINKKPDSEKAASL